MNNTIKIQNIYILDINIKLQIKKSLCQSNFYVVDHDTFLNIHTNEKHSNINL